MYELMGGAFIAIIKWIFDKMAKKKLSDKEFLEYISAYQSKRGRAGQTALDWEEALAQAQKEMETDK